MGTLRILQLGKYYPPVHGGVETFCADLHRWLPGYGVESRVLAHDKGHAPADPGVTLCPVMTELLFTPIAPGFRRALNKEIRSFRPQLLHLHLPNPSAFWALTLAGARGIPWLAQWHSDVVPSRLEGRLRFVYPLYRPWEQALLRRSQAIVVSSQNYLDASPALLEHHRRCRVLSLGLDPARLEARQAETTGAWRGSAFRVLSVGRLTHYKGYDRLIRAMQQVEDAELVIAGGGDLLEELAALVRQLGLESRVNILTEVDDTLRNTLLEECHCVCLPSVERSEAFGLVLLEAMAMGKPVVATRLPGSGVPWVVETGGHGLLCPPGDENALAGQLNRLRRDEDQRRKLAHRGPASFEQHFHIRQTAEAMAGIYRSLAGR
ncbi:MAG: glycosyltransferase [Xanthomonadales bacterium]|nr:glycosyltransferase [Xanthomonadales bacterium]